MRVRSSSERGSPPRLFSGAARLRGSGVLIGVSLAFCFLLSHLAGVAGLAPIVGAFAAGLILEPIHFQKFDEQDIHSLEDALRPLVELLAPVFFVQMGSKVDLTAFASTEALWLSLLLTIAAIVGKQLCSLGVLDRTVNRWAVGIGMIPRGEVGLIFASVGASLVLRGGKGDRGDHLLRGRHHGDRDHPRHPSAPQVDAGGPAFEAGA